MNDRPRSGHEPRGFSRRDLLRAAAIAPVPMLATGGALRWLPGGDDRALVVLELAGGNDGLNTLIPMQDDAYAKARPVLGQVRGGALALADGYGLHAAMKDVHQLVRDGLCGIVHGVGTPKPDRSHFRSRDIWHTADPDFVRMTADTTGWLGRAADWLAARGAAVPGLSIGSLEVPLMLRGRNVVVPSLQRIEDYQVVVDDAGGRGGVRREQVIEIARGPTSAQGLAAFVGEVSRSAVEGAERLRTALRGYRPRVEYPAGALGERMQLLARVLVSGFGTRLFHLSYGGFDTHANQLGAHEGLLRQFSRGVAALVRDLQAHRLLDRVTLLVFSEFGRRVNENRSLGTDHGAAGPVLLFGGGVKAGLQGVPPSLTELQDGDLRATLDFREVYATVLRQIGIDDSVVLGDAGRRAGEARQRR